MESKETISRKSEELDELIERMPNFIIRNGNTLMFVIFLIFILFSFLIKFPESINAEATIFSSFGPQKLYSRSIGKIDTIFHENKGQVIKGDHLLLISNSANYEHVILLKESISNNELSIDTIYFPIDQLPILLLGEIETDFASFENSYIAYDNLKKLNDYDIKSESNINTLNQNKSKLKNLQRQLSLDRSNYRIARNDMKRNRELFKKGVISKVELEKKDGDFINKQIEYNKTLFEIEEINKEITTSDKNVKLLDIDKIRIEKKLLKELIQNYNKLKIAIHNWEEKYLIITSIDGTLNYLKFIEQNDFLNTEELVFTVIPHEKAIPIAKLKAHKDEFGKLEIGQKVNIKLNNYPYMEHGLIVGNISNVSSLPDNDDNYLIEVKLTKGLISSYDKAIPFNHELYGNADIIVNDYSVIQRVFHRISSLLNNN